MFETNASIVLLFCILGTFLWRALGVTIASRIDANGALFQWFNCVAYALLSGLITRVIIWPGGSLENTTQIDRISSILIGLVVFFLLKRNIFAGTIVSFTIFLIINLIRHKGII